jgi:murein DD-endopeptidase MepM/ murein hydrolase activator NlpD
VFAALFSNLFYVSILLSYSSLVRQTGYSDVFLSRMSNIMFKLILFCFSIGLAQAQDGQLISGSQHHEEHISEGFYQAWGADVTANVARLSAEGKLVTAKAAGTVKFSSPIRAALGRPEFSTWGAVNYIDHNTTLGSITDFQCGTRSYDNANGGHRGTDISGYVLPIVNQAQEGQIVVAAASGVIVSKTDGEPDMNCIGTSNRDVAVTANQVTLQHADGSRTLYLHLKSGTTTPKAVGAAIVAGEYLGVVGSSGYSSGPHLHFEVRGTANEVIDPWAGQCNPTSTGLWLQQEPYYAPQVLAILPAAAPYTANSEVYGSCTDITRDSKPETAYLTGKWHYDAGEAITIHIFVRDLQRNETAVMRLLRPDGSEFSTGTVTLTQANFYSSSLWYFNRTLPANAAAGQYAIEVTVAGVKKSVPFYVGMGKPKLARVYDFYSTSLNHYFRTGNPPEANAVLSGAAGDWKPTLDDVNLLTAGNNLPNTAGVCRFYGHPTIGPNSHFYTGDSNECAALKTIQAQTPSGQPRWNYEELAFNAHLPINGTCPNEAPVPVYRLYNQRAAQNDSNHRLTAKSSVAAQLQFAGWQLEAGGKPVMCAVSRPY